MPKTWYIGCSGFSYPEWKDVFYPPGIPRSRWFEFYASRFNTLELNSSFYRFPTLASLLKWYIQAPPGFIFSAKVPAAITHYKCFNGTETMTQDFYQLLRAGLQDKLGPVLFQLPPRLVYDSSKLEKIISHTDPSFQNVIEFRHQSWWRKDVAVQLGRKGISFCGVSFPGNEHDEPVINTPTAYYRFHGVPQLFHSAYDSDFLKKIADRYLRSKKASTVYLYFNNTASMAAIKNAKYIRSLLIQTKDEE